MIHVRVVLAIFTGAAFGVGVGFLILGLGPRCAGIWLAVAALLVVVWGAVRHLQRGRDRARHPASFHPGVVYLDNRPDVRATYRPPRAVTVIKGGREPLR